MSDWSPDCRPRAGQLPTAGIVRSTLAFRPVCRPEEAEPSKQANQGVSAHHSCFCNDIGSQHFLGKSPVSQKTISLLASFAPKHEGHCGKLPLAQLAMGVFMSSPP